MILMLESLVNFTEEESKLLIEVLNSSLQVNKREQFFSWLQGSFQSLLPHEILLCAVNIKNQSHLHFESYITTRYMTDQHVKSVTHPDDGIVTRVINAWKKAHRPMLVADGLVLKDTGDYRVPFEEGSEVLRQVELKNIAAHGITNKEGEVVTFFSFSRVNGDLNAKHAYVLELLVPHMHNAFLRVFNDQQYSATLIKSSESGDNKKIISSREIEVLNWVHLGKTNPEISSILSISINTVKNHVHNTILKLGVENRAQAASMAHKLGLIS